MPYVQLGIVLQYENASVRSLAQKHIGAEKPENDDIFTSERTNEKSNVEGLQMTSFQKLRQIDHLIIERVQGARLG